MADRLISIDTARTLLDQLPVDVRVAILALWDDARDAGLVHKAGVETLTGAKTFQAGLSSRNVAVYPPSGGGPVVVGLDNEAGQAWQLTNAAGNLMLRNSSANRVPLTIDPNAVDLALTILSTAIKLNTDLDLQGKNLLGVGNVNTANGILQLDAAGKVPAAQLTVSAMEWKGTWNVATNTPTLVDGVGSPGDVYKVSVGGTRNLGSGNQTFNVGDWCIMNSSLVWELSDQTDAVASVAGLTGTITAAALRTAMNLVIGTDVQAQNANLQAIAQLASAADQLGYFTGSGTAALTALTAVGRSIIAAATPAAARTALGLGPAALLNGTVQVPIWFDVHAGYGARAVGYMDNQMGFQAPNNFTLQAVTYRGITNDASGSTTCELRVNGATLANSSLAVPVGNQWNFNNCTKLVGASINAGDIIRPYISGLGTTPGTGYAAHVVGTLAINVQ